MNPTRFRDERTRPDYATSPHRDYTSAQRELCHHVGQLTWRPHLPFLDLILRATHTDANIAEMKCTSWCEWIDRDLSLGIVHARPCWPDGFAAIDHNSRRPNLAPFRTLARQTSSSSTIVPKHIFRADLLLQPCFDELIDISVQYSGGVAGFNAGTQVLYHLVWM